MSLVVIAEPDGVFAQRLVCAAAAAGDVKTVAGLEAALAVCETDAPAVLVIGPSLVGDLALELASHLGASGRTLVVLAPMRLDTETLRSGMRAGVADAVAIADEESELAASIGRAVAASGRLRSSSATDGQVPREDGGKGRVVTVFSTKGGVGKTVLATNLGVALAKATGARVALLDLDLEFGDVGIMLGLKPERTVYDAVQAFDRLDATMLAGFLEEHSSGLKVLLAPVKPEDAEAISAARVAQVINLLRESFDYVVIDTSPSFSETVLAALDKSDWVYVVTMMDVASIKNTRISLQKLTQLGYSDGRVRVVLNRADSKVLLEVAEVETAIGGPVAARIPSDRIVPRSVNKGVPVVEDAPRSEVARMMMSIADGVAARTKEVAHVP